VLVMCTHLARSVALRTCSGNTLAQPEVPDKHAFATSGAARGYVGMRGAGHTRPGQSDESAIRNEHSVTFKFKCNNN